MTKDKKIAAALRAERKALRAYLRDPRTKQRALKLSGMSLEDIQELPFDDLDLPGLPEYEGDPKDLLDRWEDVIKQSEQGYVEPSTGEYLAGVWGYESEDWNWRLVVWVLGHQRAIMLSISLVLTLLCVVLTLVVTVAHTNALVHLLEKTALVLAIVAALGVPPLLFISSRTF